MIATDVRQPMTCAEVLKHPEYPHTTWKLTPESNGRLPVAKGRGGPINIAWEIHGHGPIHIVWIMGLGAMRTAWQRQTLDFGHRQADKYSCLIFDNRGIGDSDQPWGRYSCSEMAKDLLEVLDHVGWTSRRSLHVVGLSMGGMISLEAALLFPDRISSLSLVGTAAKIKNESSFFETVRNIMDMLIPRSKDYEFARTKSNLLSAHWQHEPDGSEYTVQPFPTNGDRLLAGELAKRFDVKRYTKRGFYSQVLAAGGHNVPNEKLALIGDTIGRDRIMVVHGGKDKMVSFSHGVALLAGLGGEERGVTKHFEPEQGHVVPVELRVEFNGWVEQLIKRAEASNYDEDSEKRSKGEDSVM